ncbi:MAG TPA: HD domain-containing phosphohydrolase [Acidobacteriota bacterium]
MARLVVLEGNLRAETFDVPPLGQTTVGREKTNRIRLADFSVSRRHAQIERENGEYVLIDLDSTNHSFVNGEPVRCRILQHGDGLRFGSVQCVFELLQEDHHAAGSAGLEPNLSTLLTDPVIDDSAVELESNAVQDDMARLQAERTKHGSLPQAEEKLLALYRINSAITAIDDLPALLTSILEIVFHIIPADRGAFLLSNPKSELLEIPAVVASSKQFERLALSSTLIDKVMSGRKAILISDTHADTQLKQRQSIISAQIRSAMCAPILFKDQVLGILYLDSLSLLREYRLQDLELLATIAAQIGIVIQNARLYSELKEYFLETIGSLSAVIEARDPYTQGHTWRVTQYAKELAIERGWPAQKLRELEMAGLLHDIGKIGVSDSVLLKPAPLSSGEFEAMKEHTTIGAEIISHLSSLSFCLPYVRFHQERYDGSGYPEGLRGEAIPVEGRLLAVADTFDAMTTDRPYRRGLEPERAIEELKRCAGTQFDPVLVASFVRCWEKGRLQEILYTERGSENKADCPRCHHQKHLRTSLKGGERFLCSVCHTALMTEHAAGSWSLAEDTHAPDLPT